MRAALPVWVGGLPILSDTCPTSDILGVGGMVNRSPDWALIDQLPVARHLSSRQKSGLAGKNASFRSDLANSQQKRRGTCTV